MDRVQTNIGVAIRKASNTRKGKISFFSMFTESTRDYSRLRNSARNIGKGFNYLEYGAGREGIAKEIFGKWVIGTIQELHQPMDQENTAK